MTARRRRWLFVIGTTVLMTVAARFAAMIRDVIVTNRFGASEQVDAFLLVIAAQGLVTVVIADAIESVGIRKLWTYRQLLKFGLGLGGSLTLAQYLLADRLSVAFSNDEYVRTAISQSFRFTAPASICTVAIGAASGKLHRLGRHRQALLTLPILQTVMLVFALAARRAEIVLSIGYSIGWFVAGLTMVIAGAVAKEESAVDEEPIARPATVWAAPLGGLFFQMSFLIERAFALRLGVGVSTGLALAFKVSASPISILAASFSSIALTRFVAAGRAGIGDVTKTCSRIALAGAVLGLMAWILAPLISDVLLGRALDGTSVESAFVSGMRGYSYGMFATAGVGISAKACQAYSLDYAYAISAGLGIIAMSIVAMQSIRHGEELLSIATSVGNAVTFVGMMSFLGVRRRSWAAQQ